MSHDRRQDSMLTTTHRKFLDSPHEQQGSNVRKKRMRLRKRIRAGLFDFPLLFDGLREDDRDLILGFHDDDTNREASPEPDEQGELFDAMSSNLALLIEFCDRLEWDFNHLFKQAVEDVYTSTARSPEPQRIGECQAVIETSELPLKQTVRTFWRAKQKYERGRVVDLTSRERDALHIYGTYDAQEIMEKWREARREIVRENRREDVLEKLEKELEMFDAEDTEVTIIDPFGDAEDDEE